MPKYCTKIDTGIQPNNLTQEVNIPLLRLANEFYTIIVDANENDKEQEILLRGSEVYMNESSTYGGATVNCSKIKHE